jgi:serine/threonine-protein kinase
VDDLFFGPPLAYTEQTWLSPLVPRVGSKLLTTHRDFLGPYQLLRPIRSGQTCIVWEAKNAVDPERVALKVLLERHRNNRAQVEHLRHEANVGKALDHPNVIKIFEFVDEYALPFIVMQLFNARNLKQELRERKDFIHYHAQAIMLACAEGLHHMHERGWVHCDVKPDNFLVDDSANIRLIDFSIAKPMGQKPRLLSRLVRRGSRVKGTRSYMSPEQIRGEVLDARADMYSFGCVCFELLSGRPPYTASSPNEVLTKHVRASLPSLTAYNDRVNVEFANLVTQCLNKNPDHRPQSMRAFIDACQSQPIFRAGMRPKLETS